MTEAQNTKKPLTQNQQRNLVRLLDMDHATAMQTLPDVLRKAQQADLKKREQGWYDNHPELVQLYEDLKKVSKAAEKKFQKVRDDAEAAGFKAHFTTPSAHTTSSSPLVYFGAPELEQIRSDVAREWSYAYSKAHSALNEARVQAERDVLVASVTDAPLDLIKLPDLEDIVKAVSPGAP